MNQHEHINHIKNKTDKKPLHWFVLPRAVGLFVIMSIKIKNHM